MTSKRGAHLAQYQFKPGQTGNPLGRQLERKVDGVPVSKFFTENLGPVAMKVAEQYLLHALKKDPKDLNALDINMTQFMINRVYGKAEEKIVLDASVTQRDEFVTSNMSIHDLETILASVEHPIIDATVLDDSTDDPEKPV